MDGITTIAVCGLATNICCFYAARDLRRDGFRVLLVEDASAGIDVPTANLYQQAAKREGTKLGIEYVSVNDVLAALVEGEASDGAPRSELAELQKENERLRAELRALRDALPDV